MPKARRDEIEINQVKEKILDHALDILVEDGFSGLSMRKIGLKMGMTAANLYNYYSNKDEIYIALRRRSVSKMQNSADDAYAKGKDPLERLRLMIEAYIHFGLTQPYYYQILLSLEGPKFPDFFGTPMENSAKEAFEHSIEGFESLRRIEKELTAAGYKLPEDTRIFHLACWSQLHGVISLYNNKILAIVHEQPEKAVRDVARLAYESILHSITRERL